MAKDFWNCIESAEIVVEENVPKFICVFEYLSSKKFVTVYLDECSTKTATYRRFAEQLWFTGRTSSTFTERDLKEIVERIVDDLFDRFGAKGFLEWHPEAAARLNYDWKSRLVRRDLKRRGVPHSISRDQIENILNEMYIVEPILNT